MTSLSLLLWILLGIALQLAVYLGISFWRHWLDYQALHSRAVELNLPVTLKAPPPISEPCVAAWLGFRTFRVDRKAIEDAVQSVCSFYLVPEDGQALPSFLPGQFLTFRLDLPRQTGGSEQIIRCYSLSDAPSRDRYRVSIKRVPPPKGSLFRQAVLPLTFMIRSESAASSRYEPRPDISTLIGALRQSS